MKKRFCFIVLIFIVLSGKTQGQIPEDKDSLTLEETWKILQYVDRLTIEKGLDLIMHIRHDAWCSNECRVVVDTVWKIINRPSLEEINRQNRVRDSLNMPIQDTIAFSLIIKGKKITQYKSVKIFFLAKRETGYICRQAQIKPNKIWGSVFIFPAEILDTDSGMIIIKYKNIVLRDYQSRFRNIHVRRRINWNFDIYPFHRVCGNSLTYHEDYAKNSKAILYFRDSESSWRSQKDFIQNTRKYYQEGRKYLRQSKKIK